MIARVQRDEALNIEVTAATSSVLPDAEDSLVATLKRYRASWHASAPVVLLGGLTVFAPLFDGGTTHLPVMTMRLTILGAILIWMIHQMRQGAIVLNRCRLLPVAALFLAWATLSVLWAPYKNASVQWVISLCCYTVLFGMVSQGIRTSRQARQVLMVLVLMGLCEGILGIFQYLWLGEPRAKGTFFNPNFFATYQVAVLSVVCGILSYVRWHELNASERVLLWSSAPVSSTAFLMAQSRGALLALGTAAAFISWYRFGKRALVILFLVLVAMVAVPNPLKQRMSEVSKLDPYAFSRIDIWENSLRRIVDHPWGMGLGMYKYGSFQYRFPIDDNLVRYGKRAESAHSGYLQIAVELGVAGLAIFLVGIGIWGLDVKGILRSASSNVEQGFVVGGTGAVLAILSHAAVDSVFHEPALVMLLIFSGGLVFGFRSMQRSPASQWIVPCSLHPVRRALVLVSGLLLAVLIIQPAAGWYAFSKGEAQAKAGEQELARDWFQWASRVDPGTTGYHDALARASVQLFQRSGDPQWLLKAVEEERLAIELNPLDGRFPYRLGSVFDLLARQRISAEQQSFLLKQAAEAYEQAMHVDPYNPLNYMGLANIALPQGRVDEARSWLRQAVEYEPNFLPARMRLAELSLNGGDINGARSEINAVVAVKKKYEGRAVGELERQFLDVDPSLLQRVLSSERYQ
jgi:O-antigen ligase/Tfp pilus assembly protein PilF